MSLANTYAMDVQKENNGVEIELGEHNNKPIKFLIARRGGSNKEYKKAVERNTKPVRRLIETGTLPDEQDRRINARIFSEACLKGWENVPLSDITLDKNDENKLADFTVENAVTLLTNFPEFASAIYSQSSEVNLYVLNREDELKN